jgi:glycosyltransferase involved in cell wall biosynthesis
MTILHVDTGREWRGGQRQVLLLVGELERLGVRSELAAPPGSPLARRAAGAGFRVHEFSARGDVDLVAARRLAVIARTASADVVHAHDPRAHAVARCARLHRRGVPLVVSRRTAFGARRGLLSRFKYAGVKRFIAVSEAVYRQLVASGVGPEDIAVVHDGVEPLGDAPLAEDWRRRLGLPADARVVGCVAALTHEKGQADLVDAVALLDDPALHLVLVGAGPLAGALAARAAAAGVGSQVHLPGFHPEPRAASAGFDIYAQPSRAEGLGSSLLDALLLGRPVIASAVGGMPEVIAGADGTPPSPASAAPAAGPEPGWAGILVPPGEPAALAAAIRRVLDDAELRERLAARGRQRAQAFSAAAMAAGTHAVYRGVLERS